MLFKGKRCLQRLASLDTGAARPKTLVSLKPRGLLPVDELRQCHIYCRKSHLPTCEVKEGEDEAEEGKVRGKMWGKVKGVRRCGWHHNGLPVQKTEYLPLPWRNHGAPRCTEINGGHFSWPSLATPRTKTGGASMGALKGVLTSGGVSGTFWAYLDMFCPVLGGCLAHSFSLIQGVSGHFRGVWHLLDERENYPAHS